MARDKDAARYLAKKLASSLRKRGIPAPYPGTEFVRRVIASNGGSNVKGMCIVQVDRDIKWSVDNVLLVTSAEAYTLSRATEKRRREIIEGLRK